MRKSRILTFLFALWPGAGQMYLGYMKRGVSLMGIFCLLISITGFLNLSFLFFLLPVIWFYAFFDTLMFQSNANIMHWKDYHSLCTQLILQKRN